MPKGKYLNAPETLERFLKDGGWTKEQGEAEYEYAIAHSFTKIVKLTPKDAEELLKMNTHNRESKEGVVLKYATDMAEGRWQYNGVPIVISDNNEILDGQHKLLALSLQDEGFFITIMIVSGVKRAAQSTMDQPAQRTLADILTLGGVENVNIQVGAGIRAYVAWDRDMLFSDARFVSAKLSKPALEQWALANPEKVDLIRRGMHYLTIPAKNGLILAVYAKIAEVHGTDTADTFMQSVADGVGLEQGSPILALRNRLFKVKTDNLKVTDREIIGYFILTFNHWKLNHKIAKIQKASWTKENFPKITKK